MMKVHLLYCGATALAGVGDLKKKPGRNSEKEAMVVIFDIED